MAPDSQGFGAFFMIEVEEPGRVLVQLVEERPLAEKGLR
jgi:hypothetical protein